MASSPKFVCLFFLLTTLAFSLQAYGRDSQFFSKVTRNRDESPSATPNTNKFLMNDKENEFEPLNKQQDQEEQPTFIPQTTETGYGLYGHETGLDPPSATTPSTSLYNMDENNNNNNYESFDSYFKNNHHDTHDDDEKNYVPELKGLSSSTTFAPSKFNNNNNNYNNHYNNNNNNNNYNNGNGKYYYGNDVQEKQGMSDTRFLENGKYYYDINSEKNNDFNNNYMSHPTNYNDNYETNQYYGNKGNRFDAYYDAYYRNNKNNNNYDNYNNYNNNNNFFRGNGMQEYRNQVPQEEEFDFDDQP